MSLRVRAGNEIYSKVLASMTNSGTDYLIGSMSVFADSGLHPPG